MHTSVVAFALVGVFILYISNLIYRLVTCPLKSVPGPFTARFTRFWYFNHVRHGQFQAENLALHRKYGPVVRLSPKQYSIDDPSAVKAVYGFGSKFPKSDWYHGWEHPSLKNPAVFPEQNIRMHSEMRKRFQALYSTSSLVSYESFVDQCTDIFAERLREFVKSSEPINMGHWMQCYAFDVIACITYGNRFGFLDKGEDLNEAIAKLWQVFIYSSLIGIFPEWHAPLFPLTSKLPWTGASSRVYFMNFAQKQVEQRKAERKRRDVEQGQAKSKQPDAPEDFLEKMLNAREENPEKVMPNHVLTMGASNIIAGSDTTAISLSAILYYLLKYPATMQKLRNEIHDFEARGACDNPNVKFKQTLEMPYLQAVMKEALRMHPAVGLPLWRVVTEGGVELAGTHFPAGTVVGVNAWVAHFNEDVFGPDAKEFRPERWLEAKNSERLKRMDAYYLPFGLGSRTCLGRHISELEMYKLIPRLVRDFEFELESPGKDWSTENFWFVKAKDFGVRIKNRKS
jgi:cytochrome P450